MALTIRANGVTLPSPVSLTEGNEIIWSANTGRSTSSGKMLGDVIAEKRTFSIQWGVLTTAQKNLIKANLKSGFHPVVFAFDSVTVTLTSYRGTLAAEYLGTFGGQEYYKNVTCQIIEQ